MENNYKWMCEFHDEEWWSDCEEFDTKEEAIKYGKEVSKDDDLSGFWVGQCVPYKISDSFIEYVDVTEKLSENVYDNIGEAAYEYLNDVKEEHLKILNNKLQKVLIDWLKEYKYEPNFFSIINTSWIELEEGELNND